jgi:hypothetical protein
MTIRTALSRRSYSIRSDPIQSNPILQSRAVQLVFVDQRIIIDRIPNESEIERNLRQIEIRWMDGWMDRPFCGAFFSLYQERSELSNGINKEAPDVTNGCI